MVTEVTVTHVSGNDKSVYVYRCGKVFWKMLLIEGKAPGKGPQAASRRGVPPSQARRPGGHGPAREAVGGLGLGAAGGYGPAWHGGWHPARGGSDWSLGPAWVRRFSPADSRYLLTSRLRGRFRAYGLWIDCEGNGKGSAYRSGTDPITVD